MSRLSAWAVAGGILLLAVPGTARERGEIAEEKDGWVERIDQVVEVEDGGTLVLRADRGPIQVESWDRDAVRVVVEKRADVFTEEEARKVFADFRVEISREDEGVRVLGEADSGRRLRSLDVDFSLTVPGRYSADLETSGGGITVKGLDGNVKARTSGGGIQVRKVTGDVAVETAGGGIHVDEIGGDVAAETSGGGITVGKVGGAVQAETMGGGITVTESGKSIYAETAGGGIHVGRAGGDVTVETAGGGITIRTASGHIKAETAGGGITIGEASGAVAAKTAGGGISVDGSGGPVAVETAGGGITIKNARGYIEAETAGGGISAELAIDDEAVDTHCTLETAGGDIVLSLPAGLAATVDAEVRIEGRHRRRYKITSDFPLEIEGNEEDSGRITAQGTLNGGGDLIRLRTTNGDIEIKRK